MYSGVNPIFGGGGAKVYPSKGWDEGPKPEAQKADSGGGVTGVLADGGSDPLPTN